MPNTREKLIELLDNFNRDLSPYAGNSKLFIVDDNCELADHLIANGVTFATDNNVGDKLTPTVTNADRIRAMTDEELSEFLCSITKCEVCRFESWGGCELLKWLQQPAEGDA